MLHHNQIKGCLAETVYFDNLMNGFISYSLYMRFPFYKTFNEFEIGWKDLSIIILISRYLIYFSLRWEIYIYMYYNLNGLCYYSVNDFFYVFQWGKYINRFESYLSKQKWQFLWFQ